MKKILIIEAGIRPGWAKKTAERATELLGKEGFETDYAMLREMNIMPCTGCAICLEHGEEKCKNHNDSAAEILKKMLWADAIVTVSPNYSLQVPANLKNLYDRMAFVFHRPRLFGRLSTAIVVQGAYGGKKVVEYINRLMSFWGCDTVKGAVVTGGLYPNSRISESVQKKNEKTLSKWLKRFIGSMKDHKLKKPSFFRLAIFRMTRSAMKYSDEALKADKDYFAEKGWMDSRYYADVRLGPLKSLFGALIDNMMKGMITKGEKKSV
jgi:multimeric flavodoxin WrbA